MSKLSFAQCIRVVTAISLVYSPTMAFARQTSPPGEPAPKDQSTGKATSNASAKDDLRLDTSKPSDKLAPELPRYRPIPRNRSLDIYGRVPGMPLDPPAPRKYAPERVRPSRNVVQKAAHAVLDARDRAHDVVTENGRKATAAGLKKVAKVFYNEARDPKIPIPGPSLKKNDPNAKDVVKSRALDIYGRVPGEPLPPPPSIAAGPAQPRSPVYDSSVLDPKLARDAVFTMNRPSRPSEWSQLMSWSQDKSREMGRRIHDVIIGKADLMDLKRVEVGGSAAKTVEVMNQFPMHAMTFGLALGVAAAYNVISENPNNPLAWQRYMEEMTDPVGWMALSGFLMTMAPFTKLMSTERIQAAGFAGQLPLFIGGLALGSIVQTGITTFARDEDVRLCLGMSAVMSFRKKMNPNVPFDENSFKRDYAACDRAAEKFYNSEYLQETFLAAVPAIAATAISGTAIYSLLYAVQKYIPVERLMSMMGIAAGSSPWGIALRGVYTVGVTWLFLSSTAGPQAAVAQSWDTWLLAEAGKEGPRYGRTVKRTQADLFATWENTKAAGWIDADSLTDVKSVCFDDKRVGQKYYDCTKPGSLDFAGVLKNYAKVQRDWRNKQMAPTLNAYKDWTDKVAEYRASYAQAKNFYQKAVKQIVYTRANPNAAANDPNVFSAANLDIKTTSAVLPGFVRALIARLDFFASKDGTFGHVSTPRLEEFLITSMACGPGATGKGELGFLSSLGRTSAEWITGNSSPRDMIVNSSGSAVEFYPPRITNDLPGTSDSACERQYAWDMSKSPLRFAISRADAMAPSTMDQAILDVNGKRYVGLQSYILDNVRTDIIGANGVDKFDAWWSAYVSTQDQAVEAKLQKSYASVIEGPFKASLTKSEYYWCETGAIKKDSRLEQYLSKLGGMGGDCSADRTQRLAYGVMNNLRDQTRLYLAMMMDLYVSNSHVLANPIKDAAEVASTKDVALLKTTKNGKLQKNVKKDAVPAIPPRRYPENVTLVENTVLVPAKRVLEAYDRFTAEFVHGTDAAKIDAVEKELNESVMAFVKLVYDDGNTGLTHDGKPFNFACDPVKVKIKTTGKTAEIAARPAMQTAWMGQLVGELRLVLGEWVAYSKIVGME